ncbi:hypothetical protein ACFO5R_14850 [Halosolutus amylolyticus]|uniref:DUF7847 domain-containing protein n=1 Tax=Halosolutus amylolyticus TaxID=2932267 RepID=A0ABD5PRS5_9EURY|nr:hypothetical protein [Halosolutus amylolyticus]
MAFDIIDAMVEGFDRTRQRNGLLLVAIFAVLAVGNAAVTRSTLGPMGAGGEPASGLLAVVAGLLSIVLAVASLVATIVALRTFVSEETETIPREFVSQNIGLVALNTFVGAIAFALVVAIGTVFLILPGLFLLVSLYYWAVFVAVEDQNFVRAFRSSWTLTRGNRLRLFGLGVAVLIVGLAVNAAVGLPALLFGGVVGLVLTQVAGAAVTVYALATTARAYEQLRHLDRPIETDRQPDVAGTPA